MQDPQPLVGQRERLAGRQRRPDPGIQVAGRGDDRPARPADVPRVQDYGRYPGRQRLAVPGRTLLRRGSLMPGGLTLLPLAGEALLGGGDVLVERVELELEIA